MDVTRTPYSSDSGHSRRIVAIRVLTDEAKLVTADNNLLRLWSVPKVRRLASSSDSTHIHALGYVSKHKLLVTGSIEGGITAIELAGKSVTYHDIPTYDNRGAINFSSDGLSVALYTDIENGQLWEWRTSNPPLPLENCAHTKRFAFSHNDAYVAALQGDYIVIWETSTGKHFFTIQEDAECLTFTPDGSIIVGLKRTGVVKYQFASRTWSKGWFKTTTFPVEALAAPPKASLVACMTAEKIVFFDLSMGTFSSDVCSEGEDVLCALAFSPHDRLVFAGTRYGSLLTWDC